MLDVNSINLTAPYHSFSILGLSHLSQGFSQSGFVGASLSCSGGGGVMSNGLGGGSGISSGCRSSVVSSSAPFSSLSSSSIHSSNLHSIPSAHGNHLDGMGSR